MKKIVAVNCSPRAGWNTATLVKEAADGARAEGAQVQYYDLYKLAKFTGCRSCFACKLPESYMKCSFRDDMKPLLDEIREADGLIIGTPNYLGNASAGFRALYERLVFPYITYKKEKRGGSGRKIPVLLIFTSNVSEEGYESGKYKDMVEGYKNTLSNFIGPTELFICGNTLQVNDYERFDWTLFDVADKRERRDKVFPQEREKAFETGKAMAK